MSLLTRVRGRKIVQWSVACFAGAWVVLQVVDVPDAFVERAWLRAAPRFKQLMERMVEHRAAMRARVQSLGALLAPPGR